MATYKQPVKTAPAGNSRPNADEAGNVNMSVGNIVRREPHPTKTTGVVTRGNGAATKGRVARGPMA